MDVDKAGELAEALNVSSLPTFIVFDEGKEVSRFSGASKSQIETAFKRGSSIPDEPQPFGGF
jgi:thioredoxin-like negative regulator of GroEL